MVTMWFIFISMGSNASQVLPHNLPLFKSEDACMKVVAEIKQVADRYGKYTCLPIETEGSTWK